MNEWKNKTDFDNVLPHSATLSNSISVFVWFALHTEVKLSIVLMDGVCIRPHLQAQSRKTFKTLFLFHTKWIGCRNFTSRLFFYLFTISATLFSNSDCCLYSRQRGILKIKWFSCEVSHGFSKIKSTRRSYKWSRNRFNTSVSLGFMYSSEATLPYQTIGWSVTYRNVKDRSFSHKHPHTEHILKAFTGKLSEYYGQRFIRTAQKLQ